MHQSLGRVAWLSVAKFVRSMLATANLLRTLACLRPQTQKRACMHVGLPRIGNATCVLQCQNSQHSSYVGVLIVGGGPAGYATAIALAHSGYKNIQIVEQTPSAGFFDPSKSFTYALSCAGKHVLRDIGVHKVDDFGLCQHGMNLQMVNPDGKIEHRSVMYREEVDKPTASTWLPRQALNQKLYEHLQEHYSDAVQVCIASTSAHCGASMDPVASQA